MELADRVGFETLLGGSRAIPVDQAGNAVALKAPAQRRAGEMRQRGLKGIHAIIQWQQGVLPESDDDGLILDRQNV